MFLLFHAGLLAAREISVADLFRSLLFILGVAGFADGVWGFHRSRRLTVEDLNRHEEAREFARSLKATPLIYTIAALSCLAVVACFQLVTGVEGSVEDAGLVKSSVREGEIWRLLTCATLHGGFLHIWMNGQALFGLGRLMESLSDRAYLPLVFLASAACGSVFSQLLLPNTTSVGASGGLMGLVGFLAVLGYRRKDRLPSGFFRSILTSILFMGVIGLVGFALIDNAARLGGLVGGLGCGHFPHQGRRRVHARRGQPIHEGRGLGGFCRHCPDLPAQYRPDPEVRSLLVRPGSTDRPRSARHHTSSGRQSVDSLARRSR